jgi:predicted ATPase
VFWVGLAAVRNKLLVADTIVQTLGARRELEAHIGEKELLLLVDNLEQVIGSAPELAALLRACPNLKLLVTSRELLRVSGEVVYPVPPLAASEATELFCARAGIDPDETVTELCSRLDNLPLPLELAAARVSLLSPLQILERLPQRLDLFEAGRDADPRQQTLRATITWSYDLLSQSEKRLFARLAVFQGGCPLDAAERVAGAELDTLQSLLDKSLVRRTGERFWMLETVHEFTLELLASTGEAEPMRERHADHYLALAEHAHAEGLERGRTWVQLLQPEHDNLRASLDHWQAVDSGRHLQLAGALGWFWAATSNLTEGARRLEHALATTDTDSPLHARALAWAGVIAWKRGLYADGIARLEEASQRWRHLGDKTEYTATRNQLGWAVYEVDHARALDLFEETLAYARRLGHQPLVNRSLAGICQALIVGGDYARAEPLAVELHAATLATEDIWSMASADIFLSLCAFERGDYVLAERHRRRALENSLESGDVVQQTIDVLGLGFTAAALGRTEEALQLEGAVDAKWKELGVTRVLPLAEARRERYFGAARASLGAAAAEDAFAAGQAMSWEQAVALALGDRTAPSGATSRRQVPTG